jgi:hypothetical protein
MTEKEILEGNRLIAEFMEWEKTSTGGFICPEKYCHLDYESYYRGVYSELKFNSSWEWIIPVCEKCVCEITDADEEFNLYADIHDAIWAFSLEETWKAVLAFIKWYNKKAE